MFMIWYAYRTDSKTKKKTKSDLVLSMHRNYINELYQLKIKQYNKVITKRLFIITMYLSALANESPVSSYQTCLLNRRHIVTWRLCFKVNKIWAL